MPEGVRPYPKWDGSLRHGDPWFTVLTEEIRQAIRGRWSLLVLVLGLGWGAASIIQLGQLASSYDEHLLDWYLDMIHQLRWFALAVAAAIGAPMLIEDQRRGALELYFTRTLSRSGYLAAKSLALLAMVGLTIFVPVILYYLASLTMYDAHPDNWHGIVWAGAGYAVGWSLMVSGIALGLSAAVRSTRGAVLLVLGIFAGMDIVVSELLAGLTGNASLEILSPFAAFQQMEVWLFNVEPAFEFPVWWGLIEWVALTAVGWGLLAWKRPHTKGEVS